MLFYVTKAMDAPTTNYRVHQPLWSWLESGGRGGIEGVTNGYC